MRSILVTIFRLTLRIFFRHIDIIGIEKVPLKGPLIFILNHPNGLVDPLFIFSYAPRPVSFLTKEPLFKVPILGLMAKALDSIPVYRFQDEGSDMTKNEITFKESRELLFKGGSLAVFPEGTSHSDLKLRPIKSGAARIALGCKIPGVQIQPVGLFYPAKWTFRSSALLQFGEPFLINEPKATDTHDKARLRALVTQMRHSLEEVSLQTEDLELAEFGHRAARFLDISSRSQFLSELYNLARANKVNRAELTRLNASLKQLESEEKTLGLRPERLNQPLTFWQILALALLSLPALLGVLSHYLTYRITGWLAAKLSKTEDDLIATFKVLGAALFFPLTWIAVSSVVGLKFGKYLAFLTLLILPGSGLAALAFSEHAEETLAGLKVRWRYLTHNEILQRLVEKQAILKAEIQGLLQTNMV